MRMTTKLRKAIEEEIVIRVGVTDPLMGRLAENLGFNCLGVTGSLTGWSQLHLEPLSTADLYIRAATPIIAAVDTPVFAEGCAGFGDAVHTAYTVRQYIKAGLAGMFIEDAVHPKRMGYWGPSSHKGQREKYVISTEEMVTKVKAGVKMRDKLDPDFIFDVRTDALGAVGGSLDEAMERCKIYWDAGADGVLPMLGTSATMETVKTVRERLPPPIQIRAAGAPSHHVSIQELYKLGFNLFAYPNDLGVVAVKAVNDFLVELKETGMIPDSYKKYHTETRELINELTRAAEYWQIEKEQEKVLGLPKTIHHLK
jgi:methylisocitrate lyase